MKTGMKTPEIGLIFSNKNKGMYLYIPLLAV